MKRASLNSTFSKKLDDLGQQNAFQRRSKIQIFAARHFDGNAMKHLCILSAWLCLVIATFLFSTRIWFTGQLVIINPYLIIVGAMHLATAILTLLALYTDSHPKGLKIQVLLYVLTFVLELSAWLIFLASISVVSGPNTPCYDQNETCLKVSAFTLGFGIFYVCITFLLLLLQIPMMLLFYDYYKYREEAYEKYSKKDANRRDSFPSNLFFKSQ